MQRSGISLRLELYVHFVHLYIYLIYHQFYKLGITVNGR